MGEVFLAVAKGVNKRCVIKTIRGDLTGEKEFVGRFADEAKIMTRIHHPNIIRVFDAGKVGRDYYIAMEFVHGRDLGDVLDRAYERVETLPVQVGLYIAAQLLKGLDQVHNVKDENGRPMQLVHRDVSPQNVMVGFEGTVKLIDFGLARTDLLPSRTQGALAVGKYGYMPPEQARHETIDGRADVYSAGVMFFEVFTGDRLVDEQDQKTLWKRVLDPKHRHPREVLPSLPQAVDDLIMKAVRVKPEARFQSSQEMLEAVNKIRTSQSNNKNLTSYLKHLYPKVDFNEPPIPDFQEDLSAGTHQSIIFATSRDTMKSVFGRGELPIEGTQRFELTSIDEILKKHEDEPTTEDMDEPPTRIERLTRREKGRLRGAAPPEEPESNDIPDDEARTVMMLAPPGVASARSKNSTDLEIESLRKITALKDAFGSDTADDDNEATVSTNAGSHPPSPFPNATHAKKMGLLSKDARNQQALWSAIALMMIAGLVVALAFFFTE